jgi:glycosyltransferase involved in cell wall biosynthesis
VKKKILFLITSAATGGGIQRSVSMITGGLNDNEYSITVVSLFDYKERTYDYGINTNHLKGSIKSNSNIKKIYLKAKAECAELLSQVKFDTVIIEGLGLVPLIPKKILLKKSISKIVRDHTGYSNYNKFGLSWMGLKKTIKYADEFIVLTKENRNEYSKIFGAKDYKIKVIPNAIDPHIKRFPYDLLSKKLCFVGRLSSEKGVDLLIEAFSMAIESEEYKDWELDIYGAGPELEKIKSLISQKNIDKNVILKGYSKDMHNRYNKYAFLVVPSRFESFGLVILEAMKTGLPVVSFDCNYGPRSLISHEVNGLLVQNGNVNELSNAIKKMISNNEFRNELSKNTDKDLWLYENGNILKEWEKVL